MFHRVPVQEHLIQSIWDTAYRLSVYITQFDLQENKISHLRDSMFRDGARLEHDSGGAEMELTFKFILSRTCGQGVVAKQILLLDSVRGNVEAAG